MTPAPLPLWLDDAELRAATCALSGLEASDADAEAVAVGEVRLQARGLLGRQAHPPRVDSALAALVGTCLRARERLVVGIRRRGEETDLRLTYHRLGGLVVEHSHTPDETQPRTHTFIAFATHDEVLERLLRLLRVAGEDVDQGEVKRLRLPDLERARAAAASADRGDVVSALLSAGADQPLAEHLANVLLAAECIAQLVRMDGPSATPLRALTVVVAALGTFTFLQGAPQDMDVTLTRPGGAALRQQLLELWS